MSSQEAALREENVALRKRNAELEALLKTCLAQAEQLAQSVRLGLAPPEAQAAAAGWLELSSDEEGEAPAGGLDSGAQGIYGGGSGSGGIYGAPEPVVPNAGPLLAAAAPAPPPADNQLLGMMATQPDLASPSAPAPAPAQAQASLLQMPAAAPPAASSGGGDLMGMNFPAAAAAEPNLLGTFQASPTASPTPGGDLLSAAGGMGGAGMVMGGGLMLGGGQCAGRLFVRCRARSICRRWLSIEQSLLRASSIL
eukprot:COSAG05_NODE_3150_length_2285_cov_5.059469_2_plen_253_part_00